MTGTLKVVDRGQRATASSRSVGSRVDDVEVSVVMPCLNEADTLAICIGKAQRALAEHGVGAR